MPADDRLTLTFNTDYLAKHKGTKLVTYKEIQIVGAFAPFTLTGTTELVRVGYECGLGEKNAAGFGMIEVVNR
jgi:CRISPR-associated endoribonuclease Cas6